MLAIVLTIGTFENNHTLLPYFKNNSSDTEFSLTPCCLDFYINNSYIIIIYTLNDHISISPKLNLPHVANEPANT